MDKFERYKKQFISYLKIEKNASPLTINFYQKDIDLFFEFLQREGISSFEFIDQRIARTFLTNLYDTHLSRRSVSRKISALRSFYKFLQREDITQINPFSLISLPKSTETIPDFLYEEELSKLFSISDITKPLGQRDQAIIEVLYATGIRVSEAHGLMLNDIDFEIGSMYVRGKGNKDRYVLFGHFADNALDNYINEGRSKLLSVSNLATESVFLNARGKPLTVRGIRLILNKMVEKAALTVKVNPHKLRHTFATHMLNQGADLRTVQELLGHENLSSTQIYTHVTKDHLRKVYMNSHPRAKLDD